MIKSEKINELIKYINKDAKAIIVGGFVRDYLLKKQSLDLDIEVYNIQNFDALKELIENFTYTKTKEKIKNIYIVGKTFGILKTKIEGFNIDFSLPRKENKVGLGHKAFKVKFYPNINFKDASKRRDFTINSIGYDTKDKKFLDPFNGILDIKHKTIKMINEESFKEDPLRVLRAIVFASRFNFKIEKKTFLSCKNLVSKNALKELSKERIEEELKKMFLGTKLTSIAVKYIFSLGIFKEYHIKKKERLFNRLNYLNSKNIKNLKFYLASFCLVLKRKKRKKFLNSFFLNKKIINESIILYQYSKKYKIKTNYQILVLATKINIRDLSIFTNNKILYEKAKKLNVLDKAIKAFIGGKELIKSGFNPSVKFKKIINYYYKKQLKGEFKTYEEAIKKIRA